MIDALIERMQALLEPLQAADDPRQYFHATYLRTTIAVAEAIRGGGFTDPEWAERWDVTFASLYLDALEVATSGGNVFGELMEAVRVCSLGQLTQAFFEVGGQYRRNV